MVIRDLVRPGDTREPPIIRVTGDGTILELPITTTCWINFIGSDGTHSDYCADGPLPPLRRTSTGCVGAGPFYVEFPVAGWEFSATTTLADKQVEECGRSQTEPLARIAPTVHLLEPQGSAGAYIVDVYTAAARAATWCLRSYGRRRSTAYFQCRKPTWGCSGSTTGR